MWKSKCILSRTDDLVIFGVGPKRLERFYEAQFDLVLGSAGEHSPLRSVGSQYARALGLNVLEIHEDKVCGHTSFPIGDAGSYPPRAQQ